MFFQNLEPRNHLTANIGAHAHSFPPPRVKVHRVSVETVWLCLSIPPRLVSWILYLHSLCNFPPFTSVVTRVLLYRKVCESSFQDAQRRGSTSNRSTIYGKFYCFIWIYFPVEALFSNVSGDSFARSFSVNRFKRSNYCLLLE